MAGTREGISETLQLSYYVRSSFDSALKLFNKVFESDLAHLKFSNARVLFVENNEMDYAAAEQIFKGYNVEMDVATDGMEAIELYKKQKYDIVFVDYIMPEMDGVEAIRKIRETGERGQSQLFVGIYSCEEELKDFRKGLNELGTELILLKPLKQEQVGFILLHELENKIVQ